ncbi:hypothetical protein NEUTE2DRAFT_49229 [Neurospora tetrasperma FGSC 2509]|nr:hypothetical protein NEUTE2DRAFT_49229 [Neurospora tetrasperma FGSC 2509]
MTIIEQRPRFPPTTNCPNHMLLNPTHNPSHPALANHNNAAIFVPHNLFVIKSRPVRDVYGVEPL